MRKHTKRKYVPRGDGLLAIHSSQPFSTEAKTTLKSRALQAWVAIKDGKGVPDDFDLLAATVNVCTVRAELISYQCVELCLEAGKAMKEIRARHDRLGVFGVDAEALQTMPALLHFYDQLLDNLTPRQMAESVEVAFKRLNKQIFFKKD
jgi:hypothetical protein